jgi:hypothetical protein
MRLDDLTIALRARTPWEATDLGIALVRAHAARIHAVWALITFPVFVALNVVDSLLGWTWFAPLVLWWLKPVFDRIVLFVISRAVFGNTPGIRETLQAQRTWGWRAIAPWLLWRRFHPGRAMLLPIDLLEGLSGAQRRERAGVLSRSGGSPNVVLTLVCANLEGMLGISIAVLGLMFVPVEFLSDSAKAMWHALVESPPWWGRVLVNLCAWIAMSVIEPFYIGAGFGLYLNRRMQLEGWDIELAFRRIAARLSPLAASALLLVAVLALVPPASATEAPVPSDGAAQTMPEAVPDANGKSAADDTDAENRSDLSLSQMFGDDYRDDGADFEAAVKHAYTEGDLRPTTRISVWKRRHPSEEAQEFKPGELPPWARMLGGGVGFVFEYGLWILLAIALAIVIVNHRRWLPWLSDLVAPTRQPDEIGLHDIVVAELLPHDIPAAVRECLREGRTRAALALLYRAAVERLADKSGTPLPPGATESDCLRHARRLRDTRYAGLFARIVRAWQAVAYAQQAPSAGDIERMLVDWSMPQEKPA